MATVTGMTAAAMQAIRDNTVVNAAFDATNHLILTKYDGTQIDAGTVAGATTIASGLVELATSAETLAGTDAVRAVTPAGLASIPGSKVQVLSGIAESATPSSYPIGISMMSLGSGSGWSLNSGFGSVVTNNVDVDRCEQTFYSHSGGTSPVLGWIRTYYNPSGGWTAWQQILVANNLVAGSFSQTTSPANYPAGQSRLYYTNSTGSGWDFNGKAGEVVTFRDVANDFIRQTWTQHASGSTAIPEVWHRTATTSGGWTKWNVINDGGWVSLSLITANGFTSKRSCFYRIKNGMVNLSGAFTAPFSGNTNYTTALILPTTARPTNDRAFAASSNTTVSMSINLTASTGEVGVWLSASSLGWVSLDGISYPLG